MALAMGRPLEQAVYDRAMSRRRKVNSASAQASDLSTAAGEPVAAVAAAESPPAEKKKRRRRRAPLLEETIGYHFADPALLDHALTHISALTGARNRAGSYQRLEFLGDHVLGLVVSDMLFHAFAKADEGEMSRRLADLVRKEACADVAREIDLGQAIRLDASEANAGGRGRTAILADVCEALIGAVFHRRRIPPRRLIERLWSERMRTPRGRCVKTVLQEWAQARGLPTRLIAGRAEAPTTIPSSA